MFWKALAMYFYVLVLLRDNGRLLGDNARRSEDPTTDNIGVLQNDGDTILEMESGNCQWLEDKNTIPLPSGWVPCRTIIQPLPSAAPDKVVCNSPSVESTATVRCYAITTSLINARRSGDSAQLIILGSQNDGVTILEIESTLTTLM